MHTIGGKVEIGEEYSKKKTLSLNVTGQFSLTFALLNYYNNKPVLGL